MNDAGDRNVLDPGEALARFVRSDRLGGLISAPAINSPWLAAIVTCACGFLAPLVALLEGNLSNPELSLLPLNDIGYINQFILAFPAFVYLAGAYFGKVPSTLQQLLDSGAVRASREEWDRLMNYAVKCLVSKVSLLVPYIVGSSFLVFSYPFLLASDTWFNINETIAGWFVAAQVFLLYYFACFVSVRIIIIFLVLRKLFDLRVNIQPFHPDGCGGLRELGKLSLSLSASTFVFGVIIVSAIYSNVINFGFAVYDPYNLVMLIGYFFVSSTAFFLPLYASRKPMRIAKRKLLEQIEARYKDLSERFARTSSPDKQPDAATIEDLKAMKELQMIANRMQVWPFNLSTILKYIGSSAFPVIAMIVYGISTIAS